MDPTIDEMLRVYAAALRRHRQHIENRCDRRAWHELARHVLQRAVWSANSTDEPVHEGWAIQSARYPDDPPNGTRSTMTEIEIADGHLRVVVEGFDKVLALHSTLEVPLAHVRGASQDPDALRERHGLRLGGTSLPGVIAAGTFFDGQWWFLDVHHPEEAVKIDLDHEHYAALIIEVTDPVATVRAINAAVSGLV